GHGLDGRMGRLALAARIQVQATRQHESVDTIEKSVDFGFLAQRRHDHRQTVSGQDGVEVARIDARMSAGDFSCWNEIGVDADPGPRVMGHHFPSLENSWQWQFAENTASAECRCSCRISAKHCFALLGIWQAEYNVARGKTTRARFIVFMSVVRCPWL